MIMEFKPGDTSGMAKDARPVEEVVTEMVDLLVQQIENSRDVPKQKRLNVALGVMIKMILRCARTDEGPKDAANIGAIVGYCIQCIQTLANTADDAIRAGAGEDTTEH